MTSGARVWDAVVVGAGPAGATSARRMARSGLQVLILEKQRWPRYKTCGGGLVGRALRALDVEIGDAIEVEARRAELHQHDGSTAMSFLVERDRPLVSMTMRSALDDTLAEAARGAGAEMRASSEVVDIERRDDRLVLKTTAGIVQTRYLVAADGVAGTTARLAGWSRQPRRIPALESEIQVDPGTRVRFSDVARFDFGLVPAGYAWVFPKRQGLSVGCLSFQPGPAALKRSLGAYLRRLQIRPRERQDHGFVIPVSPRSRRLATDRVLLTGDCAGLADPVLCEGISSAILSGRLAAAAIVDHLAVPTTVTSTYQLSLERSVLKDLQFARVLAHLLYRTPRLRRSAFASLGQSLSESMVEIISGEHTYADLFKRPSRILRGALRMMGSSRAYPNG